MLAQACSGSRQSWGEIGAGRTASGAIRIPYA
jgi:hypothetical protein